MKNWLTIGQVSKQVGVSPKALRLYEKMGLVQSYTRGENGYRYFATAQLELLRRLTEFKALGFSLAEIKTLLAADQAMDSGKLSTALKTRLSLIADQAENLMAQKQQIENILSSLKNKTEPLKAHERRLIMTYYGKVSIVVTGTGELAKTAQNIQGHILRAQQQIPILPWHPGIELPKEKPYILLIPEADLCHDEISSLMPDVVVVQSMSESSPELEQQYLKLYSGVGPHMTTAINADDRASVRLVGNPITQKGRIFYFSKNKGLLPQISKIGGTVSNGEDLEIFGFNLQKEPVKLQFTRVLSISEEFSVLAALAAVMDLGLEMEQIKIP